MNVKPLTKFIKMIPGKIVEHSPEILTGLGIGLALTTTVLAVKATPKALKDIEAKKEELGLQPDESLTPGETIKAAWKNYIPAAVTGTVSTACLIGAQTVNGRRNAALATAYQLSTTALSEYKEKVAETIGEKKEKTIHDELLRDKIEQNPVSKSEVIFTGKGDSLCFDALSGRYFKSDRNRIDRAVNDLNHRMNTGMEMYISLNEFYNAIGVTQIPMGETLGWRVDKGLIDIHYGAILTEDAEPCIAIEFLVPPEYGFNKLY